MRDKNSILFVEDDSDFRDSLSDAFKIKGYKTAGISSIEEFGNISKDFYFDLAVIDLNLPDGSGYSIARSLRETSNHTRIIILTARDTIGDRVEGYTHGADIYMVKPTSIAELLAATQALLRQRSQPLTETRRPKWSLDEDRTSLKTDTGTEFKLTPRQFAFMSHLMRNQGTLANRSDLWKTISPNRMDKSGKALSMFVGRLRKEIETATKLSPPIITVSGRGYIFKAD